jgi:membrane protein
MFSAAWKMLKDTVLAFINDEALTRGAAIAFYTVTSIGPVLLIVIAIAGLAFGQDAAQNALTAQLSGLMGQQTAEVLQTAVFPQPCVQNHYHQRVPRPRLIPSCSCRVGHSQPLV